MTFKSFCALVAVGAAMTLTAASAHAITLQSYDPATGKYITYGDSSALQAAARAGNSSSRNYSPIRRQVVDYNGPYGPNTIIVNTTERRLYYVFEKGKAWKYGVGVGRDGFQWAGTHRITRKAEWPTWTPPAEMRARERAKGVVLPASMPGGPNNPLGARALYIGNTLYRIHGTSEPWTIGHAVSSGCIRMVNDDVVHLYEQVKVGAKVVVLR